MSCFVCGSELPPGVERKCPGDYNDISRCSTSRPKWWHGAWHGGQLTWEQKKRVLTANSAYNGIKYCGTSEEVHLKAENALVEGLMEALTEAFCGMLECRRESTAVRVFNRFHLREDEFISLVERVVAQVKFPHATVSVEVEVIRHAESKVCIVMQLNPE